MEKAPKGKCDNCPLINATLVPSELHANAKVLYLAEAPGYHETQPSPDYPNGRPLIGMAGQELTRIIEGCGAKREDGNYMNAVTCRPTKVEDGKTYNRTPTDAEIRYCNDRMYVEIETLQPVVIVCLGKIPYVALGGDIRAAMSSVAGTSFIWRQKYPVLITYHPAAIGHSGGVGTERGRLIRDGIVGAIGQGLAFKHTDTQLRLLDAPVRQNKDPQPILIEMEMAKESCNVWWNSIEKCILCKQRFYCER